MKLRSIGGWINSRIGEVAVRSMTNWRKKVLVFINFKMNWYVNKCGFCIYMRMFFYRGVVFRLEKIKLRMRS